MSVHPVCTVPTQPRKGHWVLGTGVTAATWIVGIATGFSAKEASVLNH